MREETEARWIKAGWIRVVGEDFMFLDDATYWMRCRVVDHEATSSKTLDEVDAEVDAWNASLDEESVPADKVDWWAVGEVAARYFLVVLLGVLAGTTLF